MPKQQKRMGAVCVAMLAALLTALSFAGSASAKLTGEFQRFEQCPYTTKGVIRCVHALTEGGEVVLGSKTVPIVNPVTLQGGYNEPPEEEELGFSQNFFGAKNGVTLSKSPQPVPGGLLGLVPPENSPPLIKALVELAAENGLTGVNSTLEIAGSPSDIKIRELALALGEGVTLVLPLKAKLENPLLGNECYVGSNSNPIIWELRADTTNPPPPNKPITGNGGQVTFLEEGQVLRLEDAVIVDNAWSAPAAKGCGGVLLSALIDPVINAASGLPAPAGTNTAILEGPIHTTTAIGLRINDEENP
jgi:hypothetical protein